MAGISKTVIRIGMEKFSPQSPLGLSWELLWSEDQQLWLMKRQNKAKKKLSPLATTTSVPAFFSVYSITLTKTALAPWTPTAHAQQPGSAIPEGTQISRFPESETHGSHAPAGHVLAASPSEPQPSCACKHHNMLPSGFKAPPPATSKPPLYLRQIQARCLRDEPSSKAFGSWSGAGRPHTRASALSKA